MKVRDYNSFEEDEIFEKPFKKKSKMKEDVEDRKDQKRYKKSKRIKKDKFFDE